ncbi:hypothetical protein C0993_011605 [Termitomyces sp. T159_Od127]|nr:hypothetical protein C0993_011605 [Termitomyces sp. T159_Od127]
MAQFTQFRSVTIRYCLHTTCTPLAPNPLSRLNVPPNCRCTTKVVGPRHSLEERFDVKRDVPQDASMTTSAPTAPPPARLPHPQPPLRATPPPPRPTQIHVDQSRLGHLPHTHRHAPLPLLQPRGAPPPYPSAHPLTHSPAGTPRIRLPRQQQYTAAAAASGTADAQCTRPPPHHLRTASILTTQLLEVRLRGLTPLHPACVTKLETATSPLLRYLRAHLHLRTRTRHAWAAVYPFAPVYRG